MGMIINLPAYYTVPAAPPIPEIFSFTYSGAFTDTGEGTSPRKIKLTGSGNFEITGGEKDASIYLLAGGGGGSYSYGGGGGGNKTITKTLKNGESYSITIGTGGAAAANFFNGGAAGTNTVGFGETCTGGGGGGGMFGGAAGVGGTPNGTNATNTTGGTPNGGNRNTAGGNGYIEITIN